MIAEDLWARDKERDEGIRRCSKVEVREVTCCFLMKLDRSRYCQSLIATVQLSGTLIALNLWIVQV